jgi:hypothetical protein
MEACASPRLLLGGLLGCPAQRTTLLWQPLLGWPASESGGYVTGTRATRGVPAAGGR